MIIEYIKKHYIELILIFIAVLSPFLTIYLEDRSQYDQITKNINILNCVNEFTIGNELIDINQKQNLNADWNDRYLTDYYNVVWNTLLEEFGNSIIYYVSAIDKMNGVNIILERIDTQESSVTPSIRVDLYNEISRDATDIKSLFNNLGITDQSCKKLFGNVYLMPINSDICDHSQSTICTLPYFSG